MKAGKLLFLSFLVFSLLLLWGCGSDPTPPSPDPPAATYSVTFIVNGTAYTKSVGEGEMPVFDGDTSKPADASGAYKFIGWDKEIAPVTEDTVYTAGYAKGYTIQWFLHDGTYIEEVYAEGEIPTPPIIETDIADYNVYTFKEWDRPIEPVTCDDFYRARYTVTPKVCHITFSVNGKDTVVTVDGGQIPTFDGDTSKPEDGLHDYKFIGWDTEPVRATGDATYTAVYEVLPLYYAEIMLARGGASSIVSMTFDDGRYETAVFLDRMFEKYGLCGSCMMIIGSNISQTYDPNDAALPKWTEIFSHGYLEPQGHTMTHIIIPSENWANSNQPSSIYNNTAINYQRELLDSKTLIERFFPDFDCVTMAPSNNCLSTYSFLTDEAGNLVKDTDGNYIRVDDGGAIAIAMQTYYAIRQGSRGFQPLDPAFGSTAGSWHNLYMHGFNDAGNDILTAKGWVDQCINEGGWLVTMCHGILANGGDMREDTAETLFAYMAEKVASGEVWCATFSEATKYIRERQNTMVSVRYEGDVLSVDMTIDRHTEDSLFLDEDIFNTPLTVKVKVPGNWTTVSYEVGGERKTASVFTEGTKTFAYVELIPGADDATVTYTLTGNR